MPLIAYVFKVNEFMRRFYYFVTVAILSASVRVVGLADQSRHQDNGVNYYDWDHSQIKQLVWGDGTNGIKAALMLGDPFNNLDGKKEFIIVMLSNTTLDRLGFVIPEKPFQFSLTLFDERGFLVPKTAAGLGIGKTLAPVESPYAFAGDGHKYDKFRLHEILNSHEFNQSAALNLCDYFKITKRGTYRVEYEQRLQIPQLQSNEVKWVGFALPKATLTISVK
jgi:hypothetical protein